MKQHGLIDRVISAVVLDDGMDKGNYSPAESVPLVNNDDCFPDSGSFIYSSVVLIILYLSGHTCPDIAFSVNCCARCIYFSKYSHEEYLKQNGRYLKLTCDRGLILNPNRELFNIDIYPDAYFSGMYGHENPTDTACVKSRTGYVIAFSYCPVIWQSKIQTETVLSTTEAENITLYHNWR